MSDGLRVELMRATPTAVLARTLVLTAAVCGAVIVAAYHLTRDAILERERVVLERAVFAVIPAAQRMQSFALGADGVRADGSLRPGEVAVHAGYDAGGALRGFALEGSARGYADMVRILYGYDPACGCIVALRALQLRETPGIGDKVLSDAAFSANFRALDARIAADGARLQHAIVTVRHGTKVDPWQIDAISGATITSRAIGRAVNESAQRAVPRIARFAGQFVEAP